MGDTSGWGDTPIMEVTFSEYVRHVGITGTVMVMRFALISMVAIGLGYGIAHVLLKLLRSKHERP